MKLLAIALLGLVHLQSCDQKPEVKEKNPVLEVKNEEKVNTFNSFPRYHALQHAMIKTDNKEHEEALWSQIMGFGCWNCPGKDTVLEAYKIMIRTYFAGSYYYQFTTIRELTFMEARWASTYRVEKEYSHNKDTAGLHYQGYNKIINSVEKDSIKKYLSDLAFWSRPQEEQQQYFDGSHWEVEGYKDGKVKRLYFTTPERDKEKNKVLLKFGKFLEGMLPKENHN